MEKAPSCFFAVNTSSTLQDIGKIGRLNKFNRFIPSPAHGAFPAQEGTQGWIRATQGCFHAMDIPHLAHGGLEKLKNKNSRKSGRGYRGFVILTENRSMSEKKKN